MIQGLRVVLALLGVVLIGVGAMFLIDPVRMGVDFGLVPQGNQGLSSIRGDFPAFFWVSGAAFVIGAWKQRGDILLVTAALMGITCAGRAVSLALDGTYPGWPNFMVVEALTVVLAFVGYRMFGRA